MTLTGVATAGFVGRVAYLTIQANRMKASGIGAKGKALTYIRRYKGLKFEKKKQKLWFKSIKTLLLF